MKSFQYQIKNDMGMDEDALGFLVREAGKSKSTVILECGGQTGDAKRIFSMKGMNIQKGDTVAILIEGEDETQTAEALESLLIREL